ncbi:MAG: 4-hydroxy-tetrahydrodipicolinate reductase [Candidatus Dormibacteria bacterium]
MCVAGATGWAGRPIAEAVLAAEDLELVSAVARRAAGQDLGEAWSTERLRVPVYGTVADALDDVDACIDLVIDYTSHHAVRDNVVSALERKVAVVVGSSGLSALQFQEIDALARSQAVGVIAAGNFSVTAAMAQAAAALVAPHLPHCEIIDYAAANKPDAPSGTSRELAERLAAARPAQTALPVEQVAGQPEARGATVAGTQIHSVRLPSFVVSTEVVFALSDERLSIRHDAGSTATPYVAGTLLAARAVTSTVGLIRGLDTLLLAAHRIPV